MEEKKLYLLAQFDEETNKKLGEINDYLESKGLFGTQTRVPYHITLCEYNTQDEEWLQEALQKTCGNLQEVLICLGYIGLFGKKVLFVAPNASSELLALKEAFPKDTAKLEHGWTPHVTILMDEPKAIEKATWLLAEKFQPIWVKIKQVSLYEFFPARHIRTCMLKGKLIERDVVGRDNH